jgi:hypothetical protein
LDARIGARRRRDIAHLGAPGAVADLDGSFARDVRQTDAGRERDLQQELGALDETGNEAAVGDHGVADDRAPFLQRGGPQRADLRFRRLYRRPVGDQRRLRRLYLHEVADVFGVEGLRAREGRLGGGDPRPRGVELRHGGDVVGVERGEGRQVEDGAVGAHLVLVFPTRQRRELQPDRFLRFGIEGDDGLAALRHRYAERWLDRRLAFGLMRRFLAPLDEANDRHGCDAGQQRNDAETDKPRSQPLHATLNFWPVPGSYRCLVSVTK